MSTTHNGDPFAARRELTTSMREKNRELLGAITDGTFDHNGNRTERRQDPARAGYYRVVASGDQHQIGKMVDDLLDRLDAARTEDGAQ